MYLSHQIIASSTPWAGPLLFSTLGFNETLSS
jgi:hypothetical protein